MLKITRQTRACGGSLRFCLLFCIKLWYLLSWYWRISFDSEEHSSWSKVIGSLRQIKLVIRSWWIHRNLKGTSIVEVKNLLRGFPQSQHTEALIQKKAKPIPHSSNQKVVMWWRFWRHKETWQASETRHHTSGLESPKSNQKRLLVVVHPSCSGDQKHVEMPVLWDDCQGQQEMWKWSRADQSLRNKVCMLWMEVLKACGSLSPFGAHKIRHESQKSDIEFFTLLKFAVALIV